MLSFLRFCAFIAFLVFTMKLLQPANIGAFYPTMFWMISAVALVILFFYFKPPGSGPKSTIRRKPNTSLEFR